MVHTSDRVVLGAFIANALLAGGNGVAIRFSNRELAPLWGAALRFALAAIVLVCLTTLMKLAFPHGRALLGALLYGVFQFGGAFGLYYYALLHIQAGLGQTLLALVPLATLLLASVQRQERLEGRAVIGALVGLVGVGIISSEALRQAIPIFSLLAVLGSVLCFAQASVLVRHFPPVHPVVMNGVGMVPSAAILFGVAVLIGEPLVLPQRITTWVALGYVVLIGSIAVFLLYVFILQRWTASRAAYVMVVIPFVTILLSAWLDKESVGAGLLLGGLFILIGVYLGVLRPHGASPTSV